MITTLASVLFFTDSRGKGAHAGRRRFQPTITFDGLENRLAPSAIAPTSTDAAPADTSPVDYSPMYGGGFFTSTTGNYSNDPTGTNPTGGSGGIIVTGPDNPISPPVA
jgi:hypothetical protein